MSEKEIKNKEEVKATDLTQYIDNLEKQIDEGFEGIITRIENKTNVEYFKEPLYDKKEGWVLYVKIHGAVDTEFSQWVSKPHPTGYKKSNIGKLKKKYGKIKTGTPVECRINDNGFYEIVF